MTLQLTTTSTAPVTVAGGSLVDQAGQLLNAGAAVTFGPFDVSNVQALLTYLSTNVGAAVELDFYADSALTQKMGSWQANARASNAPAGNGELNVAWRVLGPYCVITLTASTTGQITYDFRVSATAEPCAPMRFASRSILIGPSGAALPIAAGASIQRQAFITMPGLARWFAGQDAGPWTAKIEALNENGAAPSQLDVWDSTGGRCRNVVMLPPMPVRITITNTDTVAHTADIGLNVLPSLG